MTKLNKKEIEKEIGKKINLLKDFDENELDSLDKISLVNYVEEKYNINLSSKKLSKIKNFQDLEKLLK